MKVLVDTGPLVALADPHDRDYLACKQYVQDHRGPLLTTWPILTEFSHLSGSIRIALSLFRWIEKGGIELVPMGMDELSMTLDWMERYADRPMDLADASLVVAALKTGVTSVWTLDRSDFDTYRLPNRRRFRLVEMT